MKKKKKKETNDRRSLNLQFVTRYLREFLKREIRSNELLIPLLFAPKRYMYCARFERSPVRRYRGFVSSNSVFKRLVYFLRRSTQLVWILLTDSKLWSKMRAYVCILTDWARILPRRTFSQPCTVHYRPEVSGRLSKVNRKLNLPIVI